MKTLIKPQSQEKIQYKITRQYKRASEVAQALNLPVLTKETIRENDIILFGMSSLRQIHKVPEGYLLVNLANNEPNMFAYSSLDAIVDFFQSAIELECKSLGLSEFEIRVQKNQLYAADSKKINFIMPN